ncbi:MAG: hypothetical protein E6R03_00355 [Hyphomicrobiaceae bacterium]|nr:MAG: hypothetical protein E6R03_00355 [Hyphomicrobiaceae bacterium]
MFQTEPEDLTILEQIVRDLADDVEIREDLFRDLLQAFMRYASPSMVADYADRRSFFRDKAELFLENRKYAGCLRTILSDPQETRTWKLFLKGRGVPEQDLDDVVSDLLRRFLVKNAYNPLKASWGAYSRTILTNAAIDYFRAQGSRRSQQTCSLDAFLENAQGDDVAPHHPIDELNLSAENLAIATEFLEDFADSVRALSAYKPLFRTSSYPLICLVSPPGLPNCPVEEPTRAWMLRCGAVTHPVTLDATRVYRFPVALVTEIQPNPNHIPGEERVQVVYSPWDLYQWLLLGQRVDEIAAERDLSESTVYAWVGELEEHYCRWLLSCQDVDPEIRMEAGSVRCGACQEFVEELPFPEPRRAESAVVRNRRFLRTLAESEGEQGGDETVARWCPHCGHSLERAKLGALLESRHGYLYPWTQPRLHKREISYGVSLTRYQPS